MSKGARGGCFTKPRRVGDLGQFAVWVRNLRRKSGVYIIRDESLFWAKPGKTVYVGRSQGKLYETLTRHFQSWEGPQEHTVYDRASHWVQVQVMPRGKVIAAEARAIARLEPRDNIDGRDEEGEGPDVFDLAIDARKDREAGF